MQSAAENAQLYAQYSDYIQDKATQEAFTYFIGLLSVSVRYICTPVLHGTYRDIKIHDLMNAKEQSFSLCANQTFLNFYFRKPALTRNVYSVTDIEGLGFSVKAPANSNEEWTIRLISVSDVKKLWDYINCA